MIDMLVPDNRLLPRIEHARDAIARRVRIDNGEPLPPTADLGALERSLDNSFADHAAFQNLQAQAHAMGVLRTSEAQTIYVALGEVPAHDGWAEGTDLATKLIVTQVLAELMRKGLR